MNTSELWTTRQCEHCHHGTAGHLTRAKFLSFGAVLASHLVPSCCTVRCCQTPHVPRLPAVITALCRYALEVGTVIVMFDDASVSLVDPVAQVERWTHCRVEQA